MKFFNIDLHISVIEDIKNIFNDLGHHVESWCMSGHNWVFNREPAIPEIINQNTWKNIDQSMCDKFYARYKNELSGYDGFICCYPPVFSTLFEKFDKPIFIVAATRYEYPLSNSIDGWKWLNDKLINMIDNNQVIPIANNKYDKFYCEYFLDREFTHIPSICKYTNSDYSGTLSPIVSGRSQINGLSHVSSLGRYSWDELYSHKCIVHIPYNVSIMSIFEQYTANVPLLFPTIEFGKSLSGYLSELLFMPNVNFSNRLFDDTVLKLADFYDKEWMPHIEYFDSLEDLSIKIDTCSYNDVSCKMEQFNKKRLNKILTLWKQIL
jgi:hypothetical protein